MNDTVLQSSIELIIKVILEKGVSAIVVNYDNKDYKITVVELDTKEKK